MRSLENEGGLSLPRTTAGPYEDSGHFRPYGARAPEIDAAVVAAIWSLREHLVELMGIGLTQAAARHVLRHAVLDLWDLRHLRKLSRRRTWSRAAVLHLEREGERGLVLDHAIPAKKLCDILLGVGPDPDGPHLPRSEGDLADLLARFSVCCVITKKEHDRLEGLGLKSTFAVGGDWDALARYKEAGIEMHVADG